MHMPSRRTQGRVKYATRTKTLKITPLYQNRFFSEYKYISIILLTFEILFAKIASRFIYNVVVFTF